MDAKEDEVAKPSSAPPKKKKKLAQRSKTDIDHSRGTVPVEDDTAEEKQDNKPKKEKKDKTRELSEQTSLEGVPAPPEPSKKRHSSHKSKRKSERRSSDTVDVVAGAAETEPVSLTLSSDHANSAQAPLTAPVIDPSPTLPAATVLNASSEASRKTTEGEEDQLGNAAPAPATPPDSPSPQPASSLSPLTANASPAVTADLAVPEAHYPNSLASLSESPYLSEDSPPPATESLTHSGDVPSSAPVGSMVIQRGGVSRRRNNPLQKPVGWNFSIGESMDDKSYSKHAKRQNIVNEIASTEISYLNLLKHLHSAFVVPCAEIVSASELSTMFGNLKDLVELHAGFSSDIAERVNHWSHTSSIGDVFQEWVPRFSIYSGFINTYDKGAALISELASPKAHHSKFVELMNAFADNPESHGLDVPAIRINPVQRLPRLCLLLEDLLRNTMETHSDFSAIRHALEKLKEVSQAVNAAKGAAALKEAEDSIARRLVNWITGTKKFNKLPLLSDPRRLVYEETAMTLFGPSKTQIVVLALFSDGILVTKRSEDKKVLDYLEYFLLRDVRIRKISAKQAYKYSRDWKNPWPLDGSLQGSRDVARDSASGTPMRDMKDLEGLNWLELFVAERETFLLGLAELKLYNDWVSKVRTAKALVRSKYWSVLSSLSGQAPPPCGYGTLTFCAATNSFIYYGGISNKLLNCFFSYDLSTRMWMTIAAAGVSPPSLAKHTANMVGNKIWIFGGLVKNTVTVSSDMYTYDVGTNTFAGPIEAEGAVVGVVPKGRAGHTMTTVGTKLLLVGGATFDEKKLEVVLDDAWEFDTVSNKWTALHKAPIGRHGHVAAVLDNKLYIWGGRSAGGGEYSSTVSIFDLVVRDWTQALSLTGFVPTPRQWAAGFPVQGRHLLVFGGKKESILNDIYLLDVNAETWCRYSMPCVLEPRMSASIQVVENPKTGISVYIFGGLQLNPDNLESTVYSDQFITFQLNNKYIQQTATEEPQTLLKSFALESAPAPSPGVGGVLSPTSAPSSQRFSFVAKGAPSQVVSKATSAQSVCHIQTALSHESRFGESWIGTHNVTHLQFTAKVIKRPTNPLGALTPPLSGSPALPTLSTASAASSPLTLLANEDWGKLSRAVDTASRVKSSYLTSYMGLMDQPQSDSFWIMSEYCKHGSLKDYLATGNKLKEPQLQFLAFVMLRALQALHAASVVHGDLKSSNILLHQNLEFKVADYGIVTALEAFLKSGPLASVWLAPENVNGTPLSAKSDVYALGITMVELAEFTPPYKQLTLKKKWSSSFEDFVSRATIPNATLRPDVETLLQHPWIKSAKTSEKAQLELAETIKKGLSKESRKKPALSLFSTSQPVLPSSAVNSAASSAAATSTSPPSSLKSFTQALFEKRRLTTSTPAVSEHTEHSHGESTAETDELERVKLKNEVLKNKLKLLKKAYAELSAENSKLKEQVEQLTASPYDSASSATSPTLSTGSRPGSTEIPTAKTRARDDHDAELSPEPTTSSPRESKKSKRHSARVLSKERSSRKSMKIDVSSSSTTSATVAESGELSPSSIPPTSPASNQE